MKKVKTQPTSTFSTMFKDMPTFIGDISLWKISTTYYLENLNAEQLMIIRLLKIEILLDDDLLLLLFNTLMPSIVDIFVV